MIKVSKMRPAQDGRGIRVCGGDVGMKLGILGGLGFDKIRVSH